MKYLPLLFRNVGECAEWDLANDYIKKPPYQSKKVLQ